MKKLLTVLLMTVTFLSYSQIDSNRRIFQTTSTTLAYSINMPKTQVYYQPTPYVNLNLNLSKGRDKFNPEDRKRAFAVLFLAGLAFTTAAALEGDYNYGTYQSSPNTTSGYNSNYVTKPFWQQTPRQIMLCVGIGFTLVGGVGMASN
jgi:hypothetical protein